MVVFVFDWTIGVVDIIVAISIAITVKIISTYLSSRIQKVSDELHAANTNLWNLYRLQRQIAETKHD